MCKGFPFLGQVWVLSQDWTYRKYQKTLHPKGERMCAWTGSQWGSAAGGNGAQPLHCVQVQILLIEKHFVDVLGSLCSFISFSFSVTHLSLKEKWTELYEVGHFWWSYIIVCRLFLLHFAADSISTLHNSGSYVPKPGESF